MHLHESDRSIILCNCGLWVVFIKEMFDRISALRITRAAEYK